MVKRQFPPSPDCCIFCCTRPKHGTLLSLLPLPHLCNPTRSLSSCLFLLSLASFLFHSSHLSPSLLPTHSIRHRVDVFAYLVEIDPAKTVDGLKKVVKTDQSPTFDDITAISLTLWRVSITVILANKHKPIVLVDIKSKKELDPTDRIS